MDSGGGHAVFSVWSTEYTECRTMTCMRQHEARSARIYVRVCWFVPYTELPAQTGPTYTTGYVSHLKGRWTHCEDASTCARHPSVEIDENVVQGLVDSPAHRVSKRANAQRS